MKSTPDTITRSELAALLGVTPPRISQLAAQGFFDADKAGRYPAVESLKTVCGMLREKASVGDLKEEQLKKKNRLLDVAISKAEGAALDAGEVEKAWINIVLLCKQRLLRIPNKVAPRLPFCKSEADMEVLVQAEVDEALLELSRPVPVGESPK